MEEKTTGHIRGGKDRIYHPVVRHWEKSEKRENMEEKERTSKERGK